MNEYHLKRKIMRRVYAAYLLRKATHSLFLELVALVVLTGLASYLVSLRNVALNALSMPNVPSLVHFFAEAFSNTQTAVKVISVAVIIIGVVIIGNLIRQLSQSFTSRLTSY